jgi:hypothetical protein
MAGGCPGNMLMHLNCLKLRLAGYNTHSTYSLGTSSREENPANKDSGRAIPVLRRLSRR